MNNTNNDQMKNHLNVSIFKNVIYFTKLIEPIEAMCQNIVYVIVFSILVLLGTWGALNTHSPIYFVNKMTKGTAKVKKA